MLAFPPKKRILGQNRLLGLEDLRAIPEKGGKMKLFVIALISFAALSESAAVSARAEKEGIRAQGGFFIKGRRIPLPSPIMALYEKSRFLSGVEQAETRRMIKQASLNGYRAAMEDLLNGPAWDFVRVISPYPARGGGRTSIYMEMSRLAIAEYNANLIEIPDFYQEALDLMIAVTPPLGKKNKNGMRAKDLAKAKENWPAFKTFYRQGQRIKSAFELDTGDQESLWSRNISLVPLQETALARAVLAEDSDAFWRELENLMSGPAKDLLSLLHSRTSGGDSIFHLAAGVSSYKEEFADGMEALVMFAAPSSFYLSRNISRKEWIWQEFWTGTGMGAVTIGMPMAMYHAFTGFPETAWLWGAAAAAGAAGSLCHLAFSRNKAARNIIRSL